MCRSMLVVAILITSMLGTHSTQSLAEESPAAELVEAIAAETTGSDGYVSVTSVAGFASEGGEALFEPGTANEERFQYASVDSATNRLVGLVRPIPLDHPAGAVVQADPDADEPAPTASPQPSPADGSTSSPDGDESSSSTAGGAEDATSVATSGSLDTNVVDVIIDTVGEAVIDPCANIDCGIDMRDPCDPDRTGQTCMEMVQGVIAQLIEDRCDPDDTGGTCEEYVTKIINTLALFIGEPKLWCSDYGRAFIGDPTGDGCVGFIKALDPNSPPQNCWSGVEMGLICAAYGATLTGGQDFEGELVGSVPAQPTEVGGVALPPPASGPGSNLECWNGKHRFYYKNAGGEVVGYGRVAVSWCGNDGTNRIRYFDPSYDEWVRWDWNAVLYISKTSSSVVCDDHDATSGYCNQRTAWSAWDVYKG